MTNVKNNTALITRTTLSAALMIVCMLCSSSFAFAQKTAAKNGLKVTLAGIDSSSAPLSKVLADPFLTVNKKGCEVTKFTVMILPAGGNIQGPYTRTGSKIGPNQISMLSEFTNMKVRLFIDDVCVKCIGMDTTKVPGINLILHP